MGKVKGSLIEELGQQQIEQGIVDQKQKNIHQRINAVMGEVNFILKSTSIKNTQSGKVMYSVAGHDEVTKVIHPSLVKHGINIYPECVAMVQEGNNRVRVDMEFTWVNIDEPEDNFVKKWSAFGMDAQHDKAIGKAYSYAQRLMTLKTLHIQSGDEGDAPPIEDCEEGNEEYEPRALAKAAPVGSSPDAVPSALLKKKASPECISGVQRKELASHLEDWGVSATRMVKLIKDNGYESSKEILVEEFPFFKREIARIGKESRKESSVGAAV